MTECYIVQIIPFCNFQQCNQWLFPGTKNGRATGVARPRVGRFQDNQNDSVASIPKVRGALKLA